jgi:hypothetical protein
VASHPLPSSNSGDSSSLLTPCSVAPSAPGLGSLLSGPVLFTWTTVTRWCSIPGEPLPLLTFSGSLPPVLFPYPLCDPTGPGAQEAVLVLFHFFLCPQHSSRYIVLRDCHSCRAESDGVGGAQGQGPHGVLLRVCWQTDPGVPHLLGPMPVLTAPQSRVPGSTSLPPRAGGWPCFPREATDYLPRISLAHRAEAAGPCPDPRPLALRASEEACLEVVSRKV